MSHHGHGHPYHKVDSNSIGMTPLTSTSNPETNESSPIPIPAPVSVLDGRPAGGTTRTSGAKTPRKVQWIDESYKQQLAASDTPTRADSIHALDEHGLDPDAFENLTHALERHRSASPPPVPNASQGFHLPPQPQQQPLSKIDTEISLPKSLPQARLQDTHAHHQTSSSLAYPPLAPLSQEHSPVLTDSPETAGSTPSHSSIPSPTHEVPGVFIDPNESAGLPGTKDLERYSRTEASKVIKMHSMRRKGMAGFIRFGDRGKKRESKAKEGKEKGKGKEKDKDGVKRHDFAGTEKERYSGRKDADGDSLTDIENEAADMMHKKKGSSGGGGGLLSALLTLYDHQQRNSGSGSGSLSGASTPGTPGGRSYMSSIEGDDYDEDDSLDGPPERPWVEPPDNTKDRDRFREKIRERDAQIRNARRERERGGTGVDEKLRLRRISTASSDLQLSSRSVSAPVSPSSTTPLVHPHTTSTSAADPNADTRHNAIHTFANTAANANTSIGINSFPFDRDPISRVSTIEPIHRTSTSLSASPSSQRLNHLKFALPKIPTALPPQTRNAGGVFGSLIASTGNITGVAAPISSRLQPDVKRPGYHLSRYSIDDVPRPRHGKPIKRPRSLHFDNNGNAEPNTAYSLPGTPFSSSPPSPSPNVFDVSLSKTLTGLSTATGSSSIDVAAGGGHKKKWAGKVLKDFPFSVSGSVVNLVGGSRRSSPMNSPDPLGLGLGKSHTRDSWIDEKWILAQKNEEKRREKRRKRKKAEVFITRHVAEIIQRQEFILKLTRAMMMFGAPSNRLQAQIQSTARVLDIELSCMYLPDVMLISFDDSSTGTSNIKFIRQGSTLDLGKLNDAYRLYWKVIHDDLSVSAASTELDSLMCMKQYYNFWELVLIGGFCSSAICTVSFAGSFIDALMVFPLGALLVFIQLVSVRNELYSNVFEITVATLFSFLSAALASSEWFCYSALASSSVVLILPGYIVLCGALEVMSRNIVSGSVRMCYAVVYSLFLGFGLAMGAEAYEKITGKTIIGSDDYTCSVSHHTDGPWYQRSPSQYWAFLSVPMYSLFLSMRQQAPWRRKELALLVVISCIGWVTNHFVGKKFVNQNDISAAVGAFAVGVVSNVYAKFFKGNAFVVMITGILFQLPSGLGNGGLLTFVTEQTSGSSSSVSYLSGFQTALQLISVSIGLTVGLGISLVVVHPIQSRKRAAGVFSL